MKTKNYRLSIKLYSDIKQRGLINTEYKNVKSHCKTLYPKSGMWHDMLHWFKEEKSLQRILNPLTEGFRTVTEQSRLINTEL